MRSLLLRLFGLPLLTVVLSAQEVAPPAGGVAVAVAVGTSTGSAPTNSAAVDVVAAAAAANAGAVTIAAPATVVGPTLPGETLLVLDIGFGVRFVPPSRVTVPAGELLRVSAPNLGPMQWLKNGKVIPGATDSTLTFSGVQKSTDAGSYSALYTDPVMAGRGSQGLILAVGPADRLLNVSTRATINPGPGQSFISGFVVAGVSNPKKLILRAVGPSLAQFAVPNPLAQPVLRIFEIGGKPYQNGYTYPAVVGGPTYESDLADSLARCGAFPIPASTKDVVIMLPFIPGNYVAEVTSGDQTAGTVLFEIYEVP